MAPPSKAPARATNKAAKATRGKHRKAKSPSVLFPSEPRNFRVGGDIRPKARDMSRYMKWPRYIRLQRQKTVLLQRLKVPPAIQQFQHALEKNQAGALLQLLNKYQPEDKRAKSARLRLAAEAKAAGNATAATAPGPVLKHGLKHVTDLIEQKKAKLVVIAHDVDPIELVVWLPALCRKQDVPFCIIKGKSRLGQLVRQKTATAVALTSVNKEDLKSLEQFQANFTAEFNHNAVVLKKWGGGVMGLKTKAKLEKRARVLAAEQAKKSSI